MKEGHFKLKIMRNLKNIADIKEIKNRYTIEINDAKSWFFENMKIIDKSFQTDQEKKKLKCNKLPIIEMKGENLLLW